MASLAINLTKRKKTKPTFLKSVDLWFGTIPDHWPRTLAGFSFSGNVGEWLVAIQGNKRFYVGVRKNGFRLYPMESRKGIDGIIRENCMSEDRAIYIGREN